VLFRIFEKLVGGPLDFLNNEQELKAANITKARRNDFMKPAKLQFLGKKTKIGGFMLLRQPLMLKYTLNENGPAVGGTIHHPL